ncbi:hypothetical protein Lpp189_05962, partial [Lacticaseibacillus paracasei subsp. paracasei Lpp189]
YLITDGLLIEFDRNHRIDLKVFLFDDLNAYILG